MKRPSVKQDEYNDIEASNATRINRHLRQSSVPMLWDMKNNLSELEIMLCASAFAGGMDGAKGEGPTSGMGGDGGGPV